MPICCLREGCQLVYQPDVCTMLESLYRRIDQVQLPPSIIFDFCLCYTKKGYSRIIKHKSYCPPLLYTTSLTRTPLCLVLPSKSHQPFGHSNPSSFNLSPSTLTKSHTQPFTPSLNRLSIFDLFHLFVPQASLFISRYPRKVSSTFGNPRTEDHKSPSRLPSLASITSRASTASTSIPHSPAPPRHRTYLAGVNMCRQFWAWCSACTVYFLVLIEPCDRKTCKGIEIRNLPNGMYSCRGCRE